MPREKVQESDFSAALRRLVAGTPTDRSLRDKLEMGRLEINIFNVALEANRSRTWIGYDGCRFQEVRKAILAHRAAAKDEKVQRAKEGRTQRAKVSPTRELVRVLRQRVANLEDQNRLLITRVAQALEVTNDLRGKLAREEGRVARLQSR